MISFPRTTVADLCRKYGPQIKFPSGLDGVRVMWAISGEESTFGDDCNPRHEKAYDKGGYYYLHSAEDKELVDKYGSLAASSFGPWQVLLINAPNFSPSELQTDPDKCAQAFMGFMRSFVLGYRRAKTLEQIAQTFNSGISTLIPILAC
jgi:hypothetical protein